MSQIVSIILPGPGIPTPQQPTLVAVSASTATINGQSPGGTAATMHVYRNGVQITTGNGVSFGDYVDVGPLISNTTYQYTVAAVDGNGNVGSQSPARSVTTTSTVSAPSAPLSLSATANGSTQIDLAWLAPSSNGGAAIVGYDVEESTNGSTGWTQIAQPTGLSYSRTGLSGNSTRFYRVRARNSSLAGAYSNTANATTPTGTVTAGDVTTLSIEGTGTDWVTLGHVFKAGDVPAGAAPRLTDTGNVTVTEQQVTILARHSDSSVRHAVFAARLTGGVTYKVRSDVPLTGTALTTADLLAAIPGDIARADFTGGVTGSVIARDLIQNATNRAAGGFEIVEQGPYMIGLKLAQNLATHLRVTMHLRWYGGSRVWCDFVLENGYGNLNSQADRSYTPVLTLNGVQVYAPGTVTHYNHAMWHRAFWSAGGALYTKHNAAYLVDTKVVPYYDTSLIPSSTFLNTLPQTPPAPMTKGAFWGLPDDLDAAGYSDHIGILSRADALFVTSGADSRAFNAMLNFHDSTMVWGFGYMNSVDGEFMRVSDYPTASLANDTGFGTGFATTSNPNTHRGYGPAHAPSGGFLPYLLTGNLSYLRCLGLWASQTTLFPSTSGNGTFSGQTVRRLDRNQQRGWGWGYRTLAQIAWALPDTHPSKTYYANYIGFNFQGDTTDYVSPGTLATARGGGTIGWLYQYDWEGGSGDYSKFMHAFMLQALGYVVADLGFSAGASFAKFTGKFIAGLLGAGGQHPFEWGPGYSCKAGAAAGSYYSTWAQFVANTANVPAAVAAAISGTSAMAAAVDANDANHTGLRNETSGDMGSATYYFANFVPAVAYLEALRVEGGFHCWKRLTYSGRWPAAFQTIPHFNVKPRPQPLPAWVSALPLRQWYRIPGSAPSVTDGNGTGQFGSPSGRVNAWTGAVLRTLDSDLILPAQGGHNDYSGNEVIGVKLNAASPVWRTLKAATPFAQATEQTARYADGSPSSRHGYYNQFFLDGLDQVLLHGATYTYAVSVGAAALNALDSFNYANSTWSQVASPQNDVGDGKRIALSRASEALYYVPVSSNNLRCYQPSKNSTLTIGSSVTTRGIYCPAAIDPKRGVMLSGPDYDGLAWMSISLDTGVSTARAGIALGSNSGGMDWDDEGDRYLHFNGGDVDAIDPVTFTATALGITGTAPGITTTGIYGKFRYVPELRGVVVIDSNSSNVAFARLHA